MNTVLRVPTKATTIRLDPALLTWVDSYAQERGANRTQVIEAAVRSFRDDARRGVPELPPPASSAPQGKGALEQASDDNQAASSAGASERPSHTAHHASAAGAVPARVAPRPTPARAPQRKAVIAPFDPNPIEDPLGARARNERLAALQARQERLNDAKYGRKR